MRTARLARNELIVLGALALLVAGAPFVPWSRLAVTLGVNQGDYAFARVRQDLGRTSQNSPGRDASNQYDAEAHYAPGSGKLTITLSNRHDAPVDGLKLRADFGAHGASKPAAGVWLRHEAGGRYSAGNIPLPKGDWVMSLSGSRHSEPLFRTEQVLRVD